MPLSKDQLQSFFETNLPSYLNLLRQMVEINSFTANPAGVKALADFTAQAFAPLGFTAETAPSPNPAYSRHLILTRPGRSGRKIGLISHLDTVFPPEEEIRNDFAWREVGERIYGPGTVDIKGGTVMIYMVLAALGEFAPELYDEVTWVILLDAAEERSGAGFGEVCRAWLGPETMAALVFETGPFAGQSGSLVGARKGMALYRVAVEGKAAHAGNDHLHGANAIVQLAETIKQIAVLTDYSRNLTFNVGVVAGGTVTNRVPHQAEAYVEMRAFDVDIFEEGIARMLALSGQSTVRSGDGQHLCRVEIELTHKEMPWPRNPATEQLLGLWQATGAELGLALTAQERGGLSDGNKIWQQTPTLDGLGPAGANLHCSERSADGSKDQEYVRVDSFVPKAVLNTLAIARLIETAQS